MLNNDITTQSNPSSSFELNGADSNNSKTKSKGIYRGFDSYIYDQGYGFSFADKYLKSEVLLNENLQKRFSKYSLLHKWDEHESQKYYKIFIEGFKVNFSKSKRDILDKFDIDCISDVLMQNKQSNIPFRSFRELPDITKVARLCAMSLSPDLFNDESRLNKYLQNKFFKNYLSPKWAKSAYADYYKYFICSLKEQLRKKERKKTNTLNLDLITDKLSQVKINEISVRVRNYEPYARRKGYRITLRPALFSDETILNSEIQSRYMNRVALTSWSQAECKKYFKDYIVGVKHRLTRLNEENNNLYNVDLINNELTILAEKTRLSSQKNVESNNINHSMISEIAVDKRQGDQVTQAVIQPIEIQLNSSSSILQEKAEAFKSGLEFAKSNPGIQLEDKMLNSLLGLDFTDVYKKAFTVGYNKFHKDNVTIQNISADQVSVTESGLVNIQKSKMKKLRFT